MLSNISFSLELQISDQTRILIHGKDNVSHGLQRRCQEFADIKLTVLIDACLVLRTVVRGISQNVIYILMLIGVAFQGKLQESRIQIQSVFDFISL